MTKVVERHCLEYECDLVIDAIFGEKIEGYALWKDNPTNLRLCRRSDTDAVNKVKDSSASCAGWRRNRAAGGL